MRAIRVAYVFPWGQGWLIALLLALAAVGSYVLIGRKKKPAVTASHAPSPPPYAARLNPGSERENGSRMALYESYHAHLEQDNANDLSVIKFWRRR